MKTLKYILSLCVVILALTTCSDDEKDLNFISNVEAPSDLAMLFQVTQDNTGLVTITPTAQGAIGFDIYFGDDTPDPENFNNGQNTTHTYAEGVYTVTAIAYGVTGLETTFSQELVVSFQAPANVDVVIENDPAISLQVNINATADFAVSFKGSSDGAIVSPVTGNIEDTVTLNFSEAGLYTITVEVMSAAVETVIYTEEFEVTAIEAPLTSAPNPPARSADDIISIYSGAYTNILGVDFFPNWNQSTTYNEFDLAGDTMLQYTDINYQGIDFSGTPVNASAMEFIHVDIWTADANDAKISPISTGPNETAYDLDITAQEWTSFDIPLSFFTDQNPLVDFSQIIQFKLEGAPAGGAIFVDNLYFYRESTDATPFDDGLLTNGDFELGSASWLVGVDPSNAAPVVTDTDGNTYYSVNVTSAGEPYSVNTSQLVELINGETYTLIFDAWSDVNRPILAGIGLSAAPWSNVAEVTNITTTRTTYSYTFEAIGFGASQARVLFDLGAATGVVNLDNVALFLGNGPSTGFDDGLLSNGDFQLGSEFWLVGVDDNSPAPVATDANGNTYYSVNVTSAGDAYSVNLSQKVEIIQDATYTLTFDAASDVDRSFLAGIGLSAAPWSNFTETVNVSTSVTNYSFTFTATGFGAPDARVLFDVGAEVGMVFIDNVSLTIN